MTSKIDEQGVYPLDVVKNDAIAEGSGPHSSQGSSRGQPQLRSKDDSNPESFHHPPTFQTPFQQSSFSSPFAGASPYQQGPGFQPGGVYHSDLFDTSKMNSRSSIDARTSIDVSSLMGTPRSSLDAPPLMNSRTSMDAGQTRSLLDPSKHNSQDPSKINMVSQQQSSAGMASATSAPPNNASAGATPANQSGFTYDERLHLLYEREIRWNEVRRYSEFIRRFATELSHMEITKENFYDLYNMALCLLKSVDGLDPDKMARKLEQSQFAFMPSQMPGQQGPNGMVAAAMQQGQPTDLEMVQRKNFEYAMSRNASAFDASQYMSQIPKYSVPTGGDAVYAYNQSTPEGVVPVSAYALPLGATAAPFGGASFLKANDPLKAKNFTGEVFFDDINQGDDRRPKRRRRRTVYSSRRNLHCHMCGVTETPEWRRGPAGDHTLCNACGLHYAKSLKKQRKERDSRKHSIDMLLNDGNQQSLNSAENPGTPSSPTTTPPSSSTTSPANTPSATNVAGESM